jgi:hypothetical protein
MRPTLPSACGVFLAIALACAKHPKEPVLPPAAPLPAAPDIELGAMEAECEKMIGAQQALADCPNREDDERLGDRATIERWRDVDYPALLKGKPDEPSRRAIALACHRATASLEAATERCHNGKRPRGDF